MAWLALNVELYVTCAGFVVTIYLFYQYCRLGLNNVPGPGLAAVSKLWQLRHAIDGDTEFATKELHDRYGHFVRISPTEVSCSHPDSVRAILLSTFRKGDWYKACAIPDKHHQTALSEVDPRKKQEMKKIYAPGYLSSSVLRQENYLDNCLSQLHAHLQRFADTEAPFRPEEWFHYWSFDSVAELVFSESFGFLREGRDIGGSIFNARITLLYSTLTAHMYWLHDYLLGNPVLVYFGLRPSQHIFDTTFRAAEVRRQNPDARQDMIEQWSAALRKTQATGVQTVVTEKDFVQNAASTIIGGSDTTATTIQAVIYFSLKFPQQGRRLRKEIDEAVAAGLIPEDGMVSAAKAQELPYLQAYIKEILRFFPPVPSGLPRIVPSGGLAIGDRHFAPGTTLSINPYVIHRSHECFGPTADDFDPTRWMGGSSRQIEKYFIPFGAGYNSCPGRSIALLQVGKCTATLLRDFEFRQVEPAQVWDYKNWFTVAPHDWPCYVERRWVERRGREGVEEAVEG